MKIMLLWLWLRLRPQSFGLLSCYTEAKNFKASALYSIVYTVYFAQYRPKDRGRSRSRIIFPCWSQIKIIWVRLQLQVRLRPLSFAYLFCYQSKKVQYSVYVFCTIKGKWGEPEPEPGMEQHNFPILEPHHNDLFPAPAPSPDPLA
jgi:hypothetical protein